MTNVAGLVKGLHHISLVTTDQELNRRFYTEVMGLRRVKLTVNQDDPFHRHLFYADEKGTTGTAITFFEWPELPAGLRRAWALPTTSHTRSRASTRSQSGTPGSAHNGVNVAGPIPRDDRLSLYLRDPDGVLVEITAKNQDGVTSGYLRQQEAGEVKEVAAGHEAAQVRPRLSPVERLPRDAQVPARSSSASRASPSARTLTRRAPRSQRWGRPRTPAS